MNSDKTRCLIIDDDPFIKDLLMDKISEYLPDIEVVDTAGSGQEGLEKINTHQPDLIFLDVEMADMTGFEMLALVEGISFETIFITSYSHYAIKAIRFNALDYLVKPIDLGELKKAITRYKSRKDDKPDSNPVTQALKNIQTPNPSDQTLVLKTQDGELRLVLKTIIRIEGDRNYSYIYLDNDKKHLVTKTLMELGELLNDKGFFRCHKSHLVNIVHIQSLPNRNFILLSNGGEIPVSRRKREEFKKWLDFNHPQKEAKL